MFVQNYVWVANNMAKIKCLTEDEVRNICYIFITQIDQFLQKNEKDENALIDVVGGLAYISSQGNERFIKYATGFGIFPQGNEIMNHMIELLGSKHEQIYFLSLKYMGSVMGSDDKEITDRIQQNANALDKITNILYSPQNESVKLALWALSNYTATRDLNY